MSGTFQLASDTAANWTSNNPTLLDGELGVESDTGRVKKGDGATAWASLAYMVGIAAMDVKTSGVSWTVPTGVGRWKVTLVGGGGQGGGTAATAGHVGNGGGSGGVILGYYTRVTGQVTMTYAIGVGGTTGIAGAAGQAGTATTTTYNAVTYSAGGGSGGATSASNDAGGAGGTSTGGTLNLAGNLGDSGGVAAATAPYMGYGGCTPMGFGQGGVSRGAAATGTGIAGTGFGAGGGGGKNGATATARAGGAGANGILLIEY